MDGAGTSFGDSCPAYVRVDEIRTNYRGAYYCVHSCDSTGGIVGKSLIGESGHDLALRAMGITVKYGNKD